MFFIENIIKSLLSCFVALSSFDGLSARGAKKQEVRSEDDNSAAVLPRPATEQETLGGQVRATYSSNNTKLMDKLTYMYSNWLV